MKKEHFYNHNALCSLLVIKILSQACRSVKWNVANGQVDICLNVVDMVAVMPS